MKNSLSAGAIQVLEEQQVVSRHLRPIIFLVCIKINNMEAKTSYLLVNIPSLKPFIVFGLKKPVHENIENICRFSLAEAEEAKI